jgi:HAD superfamily hydrolase (TIGR01509 family)
MTLKAVLLDVDGTLVDSNGLHVEAWQQAFQRHGKAVSRDALHGQMGKGGDLVVRAFLSEDEARRFGSAVEELHVEIFVRDYQPRERALPGVRALLERMKAEGLRLVLATSAKDEELRGHLRVLGIDDLLDHRTSADDAERSKPCPDIFLAALRALPGVRPEEALVIGDSPWDAKAARRAGLGMLGVLTGGFGAEELRASGALAVYRDLGELLGRYDDSPLAREGAWT